MIWNIVSHAYGCPELCTGGIWIIIVTTARNRSKQFCLLLKKFRQSKAKRRMISRSKMNEVTVSDVSGGQVSLALDIKRVEKPLTDEVFSPSAHPCGPEALADDAICNHTNPDPTSLAENIPTVAFSGTFLLLQLLQLTMLGVSVIRLCFHLIYNSRLISTKSAGFAFFANNLKR